MSGERHSGDGLTRSEHAYRTFRAAIRSGALKPGDRLREVDLAASIGLSRTPVREALCRLVAEGLVSHDPSRGMAVAELDDGMVAELYLLREVLEGTAARLSAQHASDLEIALLDDLCLQYEVAIEASDSAGLSACNRHFHDTLYRCSHNRYLISMLTELHDALSLLGDTTLRSPERAAETLSEHLAVVAAVKAREPEAAEHALRHHIRSSQTVRMQYLLAQR